MHKSLFYWPRTGVVYDTNADYVCPPYTGSRGDNLDNKPQAYGGHTCLWAVWLLGETVANVDRLVVCRAAPGERTPTQNIHCPFSGTSAVPEWPVISLSTTNLAWTPIQKQDLASAIGIMRRARDVNSYPQAQPDGNREREAENVDQDAAARSVKSMLMELCKCQQTRRCPGEDGLRLWCAMSTRNKDMPKSTTSASRLYSNPEAWRPWCGNSSPEQIQQDSILTELG